MQEVDHIFKVLIIGNSSVGKSNILLRYTDNIFNDSFLPTIGVDFKIKNISVNNQRIKLNIWDTAGQERFKTITSTYYKGAHGIVLVYDITDRESFNNINNWVTEVKKNAGNGVIMLLIGNKCDIEKDRAVTTKEGQDFASMLGISFLETSAKTDTNIKETFSVLSKQIHETLPESHRLDENAAISANLRNKKQKRGCCWSYRIVITQ